jgi:uncharacterized protein with HEPN domain
MRREDRVRLEHMCEAARSALRFMAGRTRADLDADLMLLFAVVRALEIVGEAASRVSGEGRTEVAGVPWPAVAGMRNRLMHAYFDIDKEVVWKTVTEELPALLATIERSLVGK